MTFREIVSILWRRRWLILATVVLAVLAAIAFLKIQTPTYESQETIRLSSVATTAAASGQIGSTQVDFGPEVLTLPAVLADAAKQSGDASGSALEGKITYTVQTGATSTSANLITVTALGPTPESSKARASSVVTAYNAYLESQIAKALAAAQTQLAQATATAQGYEAQVAQDPVNAIAQANLAAALRTLSSASSTVNQLTNAGPPVTVFAPAALGERQGVHPATALLIALAAGLIAGIGVTLVRDQFDERLRDEHEIQPLTGVPSLGELSLDRRVARRRERLPAGDHKHTALNEGLRALRKTLQVLLPPTNALVVFTSVEPGDGKTFLSANLALVWARMGKRVILVGGDLRRPRLSEYYGDAADGAGLAELLRSAADSGSVSDDEVRSRLRPSGFEGLSLLPSGTEPNAPADLLATSALERILDSLRAISDIVVVDSPPSMAIVDATLLASSADGAVLVASIGRTNREQLTETVRSLKNDNVPVLGVIANRSRRKLPRSYGEYYTTSNSRGGLARRRNTRRSADADATSERVTDAASTASEDTAVRGPADSEGGTSVVTVATPDDRTPQPADGDSAA